MRDIDITKGMTQEDLIYQCIYVSKRDNEGINYRELNEMHLAIKYPLDKYNRIDKESETYKMLKPVREKLRELSKYYD